MKVILRIIILILLSNFSFGQNSISGTIIDQNGLTLPGATVALFENDSILSCTLSDINGEFTIENIIRPNSKYIIVYQFKESSDTITLSEFKTENLHISIYVSEKTDSTIYIPSRPKPKMEKDIFYVAIPDQNKESILVIQSNEINSHLTDLNKYTLIRISRHKKYIDINGTEYLGTELVELKELSSINWSIENFK